MPGMTAPLFINKQTMVDLKSSPRAKNVTSTTITSLNEHKQVSIINTTSKGGGWGGGIFLFCLEADSDDCKETVSLLSFIKQLCLNCIFILIEYFSQEVLIKLVNSMQQFRD